MKALHLGVLSNTNISAVLSDEFPRPVPVCKAIIYFSSGIFPAEKIDNDILCYLAQAKLGKVLLYANVLSGDTKKKYL